MEVAVAESIGESLRFFKVGTLEKLLCFSSVFCSNMFIY